MNDIKNKWLKHNFLIDMQFVDLQKKMMQKQAILDTKELLNKPLELMILKMETIQLQLKKELQTMSLLLLN